MVADLLPGPEGSAPSALSSAGGYLFFSANDSVYGRELWISDGTAAGTVLVQDIYPGGEHANPDQFTAVGENLFFVAYDSQAGYELWAAPLPQVDLSVLKSDSADPVLSGEALTYTLVLANQSVWPGLGAVLTEQLPASLTLPAPDLTDDDGSVGGFGGGVFSGTQWDDANGWLELTSTLTGTVSGEFTSRIMDAGQVFAWDRLAWAPQGPYGTALPDWGQAENYPTGAADMSDNLVLWHFDELTATGAYADTGAFTGLDGPGGHYPALCWYAACPQSSSDAIFGSAQAFDGSSDYLRAVMPSSLAGNASFTVAFWMKYEVQPTRQWVMEMGQQLPGNSAHWLIYPDGSTQFGFRSAVQNQFNILAYAGQWAAVVTTYDAASGMLTSYINGAPVDSDATAPANLIPTDIRFGIPQGGESRFSGLLDEFAIYGRALSAEEVQNLYLRGALRLGLQVRACDDAACSGESFVGPDGTAASYFADLGGGQAALAQPDSRYFQYRAVLSSLEAAYSPELASVQVSGGWFQMGEGGCSSASPIVCELGTLAAESSLEVTIPLVAGEPGLLVNTASVAGELPDPDLSNNSDSEETLVLAVADVTLSLAATPNPVLVGELLTYTLSIANAGPQSATDVTLTDTLPVSGTFVSASPGCVHNAGQVVCTLADIASGGSASVVIVVTPAAAGALLNTASVSAAEWDLVPADNTASLTVTAQEIPPPDTYFVLLPVISR